MLCARLLRHSPKAERPAVPGHGPVFDGTIAGYGRMLQPGAEPPALTLAGVCHRHAGAHGAAVPGGAQGLFPGAGHGGDPGHHRGAQSISFAAMAERQQALAERCCKTRRCKACRPSSVWTAQRHAEQRAHADQPQAHGQRERDITTGDAPPAANGDGRCPASACTCSRCRT
jgi:hypothetical protein